jgi:hypothetical protein
MIELRGVNGALRERVLAAQSAVRANRSFAARQLYAAVEVMVIKNSETLELTAVAAARLTTELARAARAARVAAKLVN